jgi:hypothetical protein
MTIRDISSEVTTLRAERMVEVGGALLFALGFDALRP